MDFSFSQDEDKFRQEVRGFIRLELPPGIIAGPGGDVETDEEWQVSRQMTKKMAAKGWITLGWPKEYGGEEAHMKHVILTEEFHYFQAPGLDPFGASMLAPTLIKHGSDEQKRQFLPGIASGDVVWCQGYSEPGAGSDLPSLSTRAIEEGDHFVVTGQKVWTSNGSRADWCFLLVKTDPEAKPKHRGISFLLVDMKTPGITVRPLVTMAKHRSFCEVFLDRVQIPKKNLVGDVNGGWAVAMTASGFERSGIHRIAVARRNIDRLLEYARETKADGQTLIQKPLVRQRLAELAIEGEIARLLAYRVAWQQSKGLAPQWEASVSRLFGCELLQRVASMGIEIMGLPGQLEHGSKWAPLEGVMAREYLLSIGATIAAGTSEIQRNTIAITGLGLPR